MEIDKHLKTILCSHVAATGGGKLRATHAHEIVAAFLGYSRLSAMQADLKVSPGAAMSLLFEAKALIVNRPLLEQRRIEIEEASERGTHPRPVQLPSADVIIDLFHRTIAQRQHAAVELIVIHDEDMQWIEQVMGDLLPQLADELSGVMAETNAIFDEEEVDDGSVEWAGETLILSGSGTLYGESDPDRLFYGNRISFSATLTYRRSGGRSGVMRPEFSAEGGVEDGDLV